MIKQFKAPGVVALAVLFLAACGGNAPNTTSPNDRRDEIYRYGSLLDEGEGGFNLFGRNRSGGSGVTVSNAAVNPFLWRAALDTISFMPLRSTDPVGGVIITEWYAPPKVDDERFKVDVFILGSALRADGVRVSVFRQKKQGRTGTEADWVNAATASETALELESAILVRARQLNIAAREE